MNSKIYISYRKFLNFLKFLKALNKKFNKYISEAKPPKVSLMYVCQLTSPNFLKKFLKCTIYKKSKKFKKLAALGGKRKKKALEVK